MSRTDRHRPWRVQITDETQRHLIWQYADFQGEPLYTSYKRFCNCQTEMCRGRKSRRLMRRQERAEWRSIRQRLLAGEEVDVGPIRGSAW